MTERMRELRRRRHRRAKTRKLRERIAKAQSPEEKRRLLEKLLRVNPFIREEVEAEMRKLEQGQAAA